MIIDFHTHTFPEKIAARAVASLKAKSHTEAFSDGTVPGLAARNREAGIDLAVVLPVATSPGQVSHINDWAAEQNMKCFRRTPEGMQGILSFAAIHPGMEDAPAELRRVREMGFAGVKLHPVYQTNAIDSPESL